MDSLFKVMINEEYTDLHTTDNILSFKIKDVRVRDSVPDIIVSNSKIIYHFLDRKFYINFLNEKDFENFRKISFDKF
jgi:hypothetical protein